MAELVENLCLQQSKSQFQSTLPLLWISAVFLNLKFLWGLNKEASNDTLKDVTQVKLSPAPKLS